LAKKFRREKALVSHNINDRTQGMFAIGGKVFLSLQLMLSSLSAHSLRFSTAAFTPNPNLNFTK
jgi:hypothetical protein